MVIGSVGLLFFLAGWLVWFGVSRIDRTHSLSARLLGFALVIVGGLAFWKSIEMVRLILSAG